MKAAKATKFIPFNKEQCHLYMYFDWVCPLQTLKYAEEQSLWPLDFRSTTAMIALYGAANYAHRERAAALSPSGVGREGGREGGRRAAPQLHLSCALEW